MKAALLACLLCLAAWPLRAALPPSVQAILPSLGEAERHLQDATLELEAARRDADPVQVSVTEARASAASFWGRWRLRRRLAELKQHLDKVEAARVAQSRAREEVFAVLTGLEEELRGALESAVATRAKGLKPSALQEWWRQKLAWSRRVEALEAGSEERAEAGGEERRRLLGEARAEQWERDLKLLDGLERRGALSAPEAAQERRVLQAARQRWRRSTTAP